MPIDGRNGKSPVLALWIIGGILFVLFGFGSTSASGGLLSTPWDKVAHLSLFAVFAICLRLAFPKLPIVWVASLALFVGLVDEMHQFLVPTRQPGIDDWLADAFGIACGLLGWHLIFGPTEPCRN